MRTHTLFLILALTTGIAGFAQTPAVPSRLPVKPETKPSPNLRVYRPADLMIQAVSLVSCNRNDAHGAYDITVSVTVRNNGELGSDPLTKLKAFYAPAAGLVKVPTPYPKGANDPGERITAPWTYCAAEPSIGRVDGGNTWTQTVSFEALYQSFTGGGGKFYLLLLADYYNNTKESDEHNNYSIPLFITPSR